MSIFNRHTTYEQLVTEYVDGVLDEASEAKLRKHLETCASCEAEVREQREVASLLRAQPMVAAPRSFALPYAPPKTERAAAGGLTGLLRTLQVATAGAAVMLIAIVGMSLTGGPLTTLQPTDDQTAVSMVDQQDATLQERDGDVRMTSEDSAAPEQDDRIFMFSPTGRAIESEPPAAESEPAITDSFFDAAETGEGNQEEAERAPSAKTLDEAQLTQVEPERSPLEWALISSSALTALLALSVVGVSWRGRQGS